MGAAQCCYPQLGIDWQYSLGCSSHAYGGGMRLCCSEAGSIDKKEERENS